MITLHYTLTEIIKRGSDFRKERASNRDHS